MPAQGSVIVRVYSSDAYLPLPGAAVVFTTTTPDQAMRLLALRTTDSSGLTAPLYLDTPDLAESLSPDPPVLPYTTVDIRVSYPNHNSAGALGVQVFPGVETVQSFRLRPVSADAQGDTVTYRENAQNL